MRNSLFLFLAQHRLFMEMKERMLITVQHLFMVLTIRITKRLKKKTSKTFFSKTQTVLPNRLRIIRMQEDRKVCFVEINCLRFLLIQVYGSKFPSGVKGQWP